MTKQVDFYENLQKLGNLCISSEKLVTVPQNLPDEIKCILKESYDFTKNEEEKLLKSAALPELITENFDLEQIWQQLELQNDEVLDPSLLTVSRAVAGKSSLFFNDVEKEIIESNVSEAKDEQNEKTNESDSSDSESSDNDLNGKEIDDSDGEPSLHDSDESDEENEPKEPKNRKKSAVDDKFFKLEEMENFLNAEESKLGEKKVEKDPENSSESDDEGSIDLFKEDSDDEKREKENQKLNNPRYKDFFREQNTEAKKPKRNKFFENEYDEENGSEADENEDKSEFPKSSLQLREERLKRKIEHIEEKALSDKPWQLKGEITAEDRPPNSLLEEIVDFELTTRPAPVITEETSLYLEDVIRQRIKDKAFDSVIRITKPIETPLEYRKKLVLDQEKSKDSLAQIYEKDYLKQKESLDPDANEKEEEEPELHKEIKKMMNGLFTKLDALSNFHFTPKPVMPELKIVRNLPAISMEEVAPVATSDAALLAPEEIKKKPKGDPLGKGERTTTDKKRERRKKKLKQKVHAQIKKKREESNIGLGKKYKGKTKNEDAKVLKNKNVEKMDENYNTKGVKSSTAFFTQLQEEVQTQIKSKIGLKRKKQTNTVDAKKIKL